MWTGAFGRDQGVVSQKSEVDESSQKDYQYDNSTQLSTKVPKLAQKQYENFTPSFIQ